LIKLKLYKIIILTILMLYEFSRNGNTIVIDKPINISHDMFFDKYWFIVSQPGNIYKSYYYLEKMSNIWINCKYRKCRYSKDLFFKVNKMAKNI